MAATIDLCDFLNADGTAREIGMKWMQWDNARHQWLKEKQEIQQYIFAVDTSVTSASSLPWKNRTHVPKLCQIRDNLHANYMARLFPNDNAIVWEGDDTNSEERDKRLTIQNYMKNKMKQTKFRSEVSRLVYDYIDYGNTIAMPVFVADYVKDPHTGEETAVYVGPRIQRINPMDIVFNPTAASFEESPKIVRSIRTIGNILSDAESKPELGYLKEAIEEALENRRRFSGNALSDYKKNDLFNISGFGSFYEYFTSDYVEILDFYGDFYDKGTKTLHRNHLISVIDRSKVIRQQTNDNWLGAPPIRHVGWRIRQDNLWAMGPLDNLVGMQHRIDHLENARADAVDLIIHPVIKVKGDVDDFSYGPGERVYVSEEGDVEFMSPDTTFLQADVQIKMYEDKMEEMAGAPKQAMGLRTPGEKTAFEVQILENGANRVFDNKVSYFEEMFLEPLLNDMLELAVRNLNEVDTIRVLDDETQAVTFQKITSNDIRAKGVLRPIGARHFMQNANTLQNLTQLSQSGLGQNQLITSHFSGKRLALAVEQLLGLEKYKIFQPNIGLYEAAELRQVQASLDQAHAEEQTAGMDPQTAAQATAQMFAPTDAQGKPVQQ